MGLFTATANVWAIGNKITAALLNAQMKDLINGFGPKDAYVATLGGFTKGNGTIDASYSQWKNLIWFEATFTMGSTSAAAAAVPTITLPVTAASSALNVALTRAQFTDAGTAAYLAAGRLLSVTTCAAYIIGASGIVTTPSTTAPFTWTPANGDSVYWAGLYEAA